MIRPICHDPVLLSMKAEPATADDLSVAQDLLDTLQDLSDRCVGMAANMIGVPKRIIVVAIGPVHQAMLNPVISAKKQPYSTEEGCLSLDGVRPVKRCRTITVVYQDMNMIQRRMTYSGFTAQIIQHECDHLEGILI